MFVGAHFLLQQALVFRKVQIHCRGLRSGVPCVALPDLVKARFALFEEGRRGFLDVTTQAAQDLVAVFHLHSRFQ